MVSPTRILYGLVPCAAFIGLLLFANMAVAQTLDQYGGYTNLPAPGGATGFFRVEKIAGRWLFVTPDGNALWMAGVFNIDGSGSIPDQGISYDQIVAQKYPDKPTWGNQALKRLSSWGFNTVAEYASTYVFPFGRPTGALLLPMANTMRPSWYGLTNWNSFGPGPFKALEDCVDSAVYTGWVSDGPPDVYDPNFDGYVNGLLKATAADPFWGQFLTSPWMVGMAVDDADQLQGFGPGTEIQAPDGVVAVHIGYLALVVSPAKAASSRYGVTYTDPTVYTKTALRNFLATKYGSIGALNAAWGSNYTTFDSAGGWRIGTGLMDENGRNTAWLGNTDATLRGAAPAVVADLDAFLYQYAAKYFSITAGRLRQYAPNRLVFGPAVLNGHGGLTRGSVLQAAGQYLDVIQAGVTSQQVLDMTVHYVGDKPIVTWEGLPANPDSSLWRYPNTLPGAFATQSDRGAWYAAKINFLLNSTSGGTHPIAGFKWWAWLDSWGEKTNWGLVSFRDNAYDGKEALVASGTDPWGYSTGGEELNYGDFVSAVAAANAEIISAVTGGAGTTSPTLTASVTTPTNGTTVQGTVSVAAQASSTATRIALLLDGALVGAYSGSTASYQWNTTATGNGLHAWTAQAYDSSGSSATSPSVDVTVSNLPTLTVSITNPVNGAVIPRRSTLALAATTSTTGGVTVQFSANGSALCSTNVAPYSCNWKVPGAPNRTYTITAVATNTAGQTASAQPIQVTTSR